MEAAHVKITRDGDPVQIDPFMVCDECGEHICSVEEGDTLDVLLATAREHACERDEPSESEITRQWR